MTETATHPQNFIDLSGQKFGRLTALRYIGPGADSSAMWECSCACGNTKPALSANLLNGRTTSCGCFHVEASRDRLATHGHSDSPEYSVWRNIRARCNNPNVPGYRTHGAAGIRCEWQDFSEFLEDVGYRPSPEHRLYRLDTDQHFNALNCFWLLPSELKTRRVG